MTNLAIPLADWGMGTTLIVIFALVCVMLTAIVLSFIFGGKKKDGDGNVGPSDDETF